MNRGTTLAYIVILGNFVSSITNAQTIDVSPYSIYGIGLINSGGSALNKSLSGTGIGVSSDQFVNMLNPASYVSLGYVTQITEAGFYLQKNAMVKNSIRASSTTANFTAMNFWFRLSKNWAGAIGIAPYSTVGYNINSNRSLNYENNVQVNYTGNGGITKYFVGNGIRVAKNLNLGVSGYLLHGSFLKSQAIASGAYAGLEISTKTYLSGVGYEGGLQYRITTMPDKQIILGLIYNSSSNLNSQKQLAVVNSVTLDSLYSALYDISNYISPAKIGFGISYNTNKHLLAWDVSRHQYTQNYRKDNVRIRHTYRVSGGYEFKGNQDQTKYWSYVRPRISVFAEQNEALVLNQKYLKWGGAVGAALPVANGRGFVHVTYNYNHSGTSTRDLVIQHTHSLSLDFSFQDLWGIRRKFD